jgi:integrase
MCMRRSASKRLHPITAAQTLQTERGERVEWSQVDLKRQLACVHPDQAKARRAIAVPLNGEAMALLRKQVGKHPTYVFSYKGAHCPSQHQGLVRGAKTSRHRGLSLARSEARLGNLARTERNAAVRVAGVGRLAESRDGAPL